NGADLHFAIIDGLGHGLGSTLLTGLAVGAYRHARRNGAPVADMHAAIDEVLAEYYDDISFATGIVARLATGSGRLEWSCAGHPRPLLLRGRKVVAELSCDPILPFGLGDMTPKPVIEELEPDDMLLLYTDGVTEARTADGELFGLDRLADLLEREAASGLTAAPRGRASGQRQAILLGIRCQWCAATRERSRQYSKQHARAGISAVARYGEYEEVTTGGNDRWPYARWDFLTSRRSTAA